MSYLICRQHYGITALLKVKNKSPGTGIIGTQAGGSIRLFSEDSIRGLEGLIQKTSFNDTQVHYIFIGF